MPQKDGLSESLDSASELEGDSLLQEWVNEALSQFLDHEDPASLVGRHVLESPEGPLEARVSLLRRSLVGLPGQVLLQVVVSDGTRQASAVGAVGVPQE